MVNLESVEPFAYTAYKCIVSVDRKDGGKDSVTVLADYRKGKWKFDYWEQPSDLGDDFKVVCQEVIREALEAANLGKP